MRLSTRAVWLAIALSMAASRLSAEEYDFELDVDFGSTRFDGNKTITTSGGTIFNSGTLDTDRLSIDGTWYLNGLSDADGPRARADLTSRASSLSFEYARLELETSAFLTNDDPSLPFITPLDSRFKTSGDLFAVDYRHVDRDSGWFGGVRLQVSETGPGGLVDASLDATEWRVSAGKYLFENTTVSIGTGRIEFDFEDTTLYEVSVEHLGALGDRWQYGVDVNWDRADRSFFDQETIGASLSLYPTRNLEFGIAITEAIGDIGFAGSESSYAGFASWFVRPNLRLSASYRSDDVDFLGNVFVGGSEVRDADQDSFGISATWRFD